MKRENRDLLLRALGQIEGVGLVGDEKMRNALFCAVDMIEAVLDAESENSDGK